MFPSLQSRPSQYLLLVLTWAILCLPNLGIPCLWEVDEGHNAEASQEMWQDGNWIVPAFNYEMRDDKPALLYWLQVACYAVVGANETGARLPSALAALAAILITCELGRRLFNATVGLLAGLILASTISFAVAAHFANPDALLTLFTLLTLACFWHDYRTQGRFRYIGGAIACGLAMLAKGPIGLVIPLSVIFLFLLWQRKLRLLLDPRQLYACLAFTLTAAPWYVWVAVETKGHWVARFWLKHHWYRFFGRTAMEGHGGPFYLMLGFLLVGFGLWSIFLLPAILHAFRKPAPSAEPQDAFAEKQPGPLPHIPPQVRFLLCWIGFVLLFFSVSKTKLPNYILPLYPALAILMAHLFADWFQEGAVIRKGLVSMGLVCLGLVGIVTAVGVVLVTGVGEMEFLHRRYIPELTPLAVAGLIPLLGAVAAAWALKRGQRRGVVVALTVTSVCFLTVMGSWGAPVVSQSRAPRALVRQTLPADQLRREIRVAACEYFQPSLVFYARRQVEKLKGDEVREFLRGTLPSYLFLPAPTWERLRGELADVAEPLGRHADFHYTWDIIVVGNKAALAIGH